MFERFTADARRTVVAARTEAVGAGHPQVGTEHLLIALAGEDGPAGTVLRTAGVTADAVRDEVRRRARPAAPLLDEQDAAALRSVGIDLDAVLARIEETFGTEALLPTPADRGRWFGRRSRSGRFGPRSKKVLELALREAIRLRSNEIGSGMILLGLLREGEGLAAQILHDRGVDLAELRRRVEHALPKAA